jgi:hypothetical protein
VEEGGQPPDSTDPSTPPGTTTPPPSSGGDNPGVDKAVQDIGAALEQLKTAQQSGDFAAQGDALAALEKAVGEYEAAKATPPAGGGG